MSAFWFCPFPRLRGKAGMGASLRKAMRNHAAHTLQVRHDFIIPEAQHLESFRFHEAVTMQVVLASVVLSTVHFDDQSDFQTGEIGNVRPHRMLAAKSVAVHLSCFKHLPEFSLGWGHVTAQLPCPVPLLPVSHVHVLCDC